MKIDESAFLRDGPISCVLGYGMASGRTTEGEPIAVFYSYSHKDEAFCKRLQEQLEILVSNRLLTGWYDREMTAGTDWAGQIDENLDAADLILLLVSSSFLASKYCHDVEMTRALERHSTDEARVVPIILRPCLWQESRFASLQVVPRDGQPVTTWGDEDSAFLEVAKAIRLAAEEMRAKRISQVISPSVPGKVWNLPARNPFFTGRKEVLDQLRGAYASGENHYATSHAANSIDLLVRF